MKTRTFEDGVLAAVNLGADADATAAIYGQLAGALYGADAIPACWLDKLVMRERIIELADGLYALSKTISPDASVAPAAAVVAGATEPAAPPMLPGDSFWVIEGRLLAGPYPGAPSKTEARAKLEAFLDAGVTCFVDLTEEGEGPPLHSYSRLLRHVAHKRKTRVTHLRLPIRDVDIPMSWQMRTILAAIRFAIAEGETVYLHCWGGVGRTGTVVGCLLVEDGVPVEQVLTRLADLRRHTQRAHRTSPETQDQKYFVENWNGQGTLVLDQQAIDRLGLAPVPADPAPVPSLGEIVASLQTGSPVVIEGPGPGWCVQAVADMDEQIVNIEILDPERWESGPPLPAEQQTTIETLGFDRQEGMWRRVEHDEDGLSALRRAAELMIAVVERAWGLRAPDAGRLDDVPPPDAL